MGAKQHILEPFLEHFGAYFCLLFFSLSPQISLPKPAFVQRANPSTKSQLGNCNFFIYICYIADTAFSLSSQRK